MSVGIIIEIDCLIASLWSHYQNGFSSGNRLQKAHRFFSVTIVSGLGEGHGLFLI